MLSQQDTTLRETLQYADPKWPRAGSDNANPRFAKRGVRACLMTVTFNIWR